MHAEDIAKLKIEKSEKIIKPSRHRKKPLVITAVVLLLLTAGGLYFGGILVPAISIDVTTISQFYPSQSMSLLNASGYIVAQRKAAVASKVTGRLVALMVEERSKIKQGDAIARAIVTDPTILVADEPTGEIGTMRALGFRRRSILAAFIAESLLLGFIGGMLPALRASRMKIVEALRAA